MVDLNAPHGETEFNVHAINAIAVIAPAHLVADTMAASDEHDIQTELLDQFEEGNAAYIKTGNSSALIIKAEGTFLVSFDTSISRSDWNENLTAGFVEHPYMQGAQIHEGFLKALSKDDGGAIHYDKIKDAIVEMAGPDGEIEGVLLTGLSRGGAQAHIAASMMVSEGFPKSEDPDATLGVYTLNTPAIGDSRFATQYKELMDQNNSPSWSVQSADDALFNPNRFVNKAMHAVGFKQNENTVYITPEVSENEAGELEVTGFKALLRPTRGQIDAYEDSYEKIKDTVDPEGLYSGHEMAITAFLKGQKTDGTESDLYRVQEMMDDLEVIEDPAAIDSYIQSQMKVTGSAAPPESQNKAEMEYTR